MKEDVIEVEVLSDGTVKTTTDNVSGPNHQNAEDFLQFLASKLGGTVTRQKRPHAVHHQHQHVQARR